MTRVTELRIGPEGQVAQHASVAGQYGTQQLVWVGISWPDGLLTLHRYTDDEVADWRAIDLEA